MVRQNWQEVRGDETLALDWPLDENSHIWEIGGYEGRWVQQMWDRYHCNITVFEPQLWAVRKMQERFKGIDKIEIRPYGLWLNDNVMGMGNFDTDGASVVSHDASKAMGSGLFHDFYDVISSFNFNINLCLMNVEGAEYSLIPNMITSDQMGRFEFFWCQFHPDLYEDAGARTWEIFEKMLKTHDLLWDCFPTAVAWCPK